MASANFQGIPMFSLIYSNTTGTFPVSIFAILGDFTDALPALENDVFATILLVVYAFIAQIVLINLLIAMMGDTFTAVKEKSNKEWKFSRWIFAIEYTTASHIPPPFNLILLFHFLYRLIRGKQLKITQQHKIQVFRNKNKSNKKPTQNQIQEVQNKDQAKEEMIVKNLLANVMEDMMAAEDVLEKQQESIITQREQLNAFLAKDRASVNENSNKPNSERD
eukprot:TRINITY_DN6633_c0_g1_i1.p1 TRINITY_DN6633_c0_g1~~TRINITY_DN6633_c0_g1_i1.p1  ORF type:complete len:221 (+),score=40.24 TRINITY_DN6633_c0_g1_i1:479-1141(+)